MTLLARMEQEGADRGGAPAVPEAREPWARGDASRTSDAPERALVVRMPNWLGDLVMALPALRGAGEALPGVGRVAVVPAALAPLLEGAAEAVVPVERGRSSQALARLAPYRAEGAIILTTSFSSAYLLRRAGVRRLIGYPTEGRWVLGVRGPSRPRAHLAEQYARLVDELGPWSRDLVPRLPAAAAAREVMARRLDEFGLGRSPRVAVFPGAAYGPAKRWPHERFAAVARTLAAGGAGIAVLGSAGERPLAAAVAEAAGLPPESLGAGRTSLLETAGLLAHADLVLANDSGALHLAASCGARTVGVFGSTDPGWTAPPGAAVLRRPTPCAPCFRRTCDIGYRCLTNVTVDEVREVCIELLAGRTVA